MAVRFNDRQTRAERKAQDRLAPIREFFEKFVKTCQVCYHVGEDVTIDEKLEGFFYTCNMEIFAGKQPEGFPTQQ